MRLQNGVWALPGTRASRRAEPYSRRAPSPPFCRWRTLWFSEGKCPAQGHTAGKGQSWESSIFFLVQLQDVLINKLRREVTFSGMK